MLLLKNTFFGQPVYFIRSLRNSIRQREDSLLLCISSVLLPGKFYNFSTFIDKNVKRRLLDSNYALQFEIQEVQADDIIPFYIMSWFSTCFLNIVCFKTSSNTYKLHKCRLTIPQFYRFHCSCSFFPKNVRKNKMKTA